MSFASACGRGHNGQDEVNRAWRAVRSFTCTVTVTTACSTVKQNPGLTKRVAVLGMPAIAITDHGNLYGAVELMREAKAAGVQPIVGLEAYVAPGKRQERGGPRGRRASTLTTSRCLQETRRAFGTLFGFRHFLSSRDSIINRGSIRRFSTVIRRG